MIIFLIVSLRELITHNYICFEINHHKIKDPDLFNLISCLYNGTLNPSEVEQDFNKGIEEESLLHKAFLNDKDNRRKLETLLEGPLNFSNQSSVCSKVLFDCMSQQKNQIPKYLTRLRAQDTWIKTYQEVFERLRNKRAGKRFFQVSLSQRYFR
jgi:hypothetical protein